MNDNTKRNKGSKAEESLQEFMQTLFGGEKEELDEPSKELEPRVTAMGKTMERFGDGDLAGLHVKTANELAKIVEEEMNIDLVKEHQAPFKVLYVETLTCANCNDHAQITIVGTDNVLLEFEIVQHEEHTETDPKYNVYPSAVGEKRSTIEWWG